MAKIKSVGATATAVKGPKATTKRGFATKPPAKGGKPAAKAPKAEGEGTRGRPKGLLTPKEAEVLLALSNGEKSKAELNITAKVMGAASKDDNGSQGGGLIGKGYVVRAMSEGRGVSYKITKTGIQVLAQYNKSLKA